MRLKVQFSIFLGGLVALVGIPTTSDAGYVAFKGSTVGGPTFNRPNDNAGNPPSSLNSDLIPYHTQTFQVDTDGFYDLLSYGTDPYAWDNFLALYQGSLDPSNPLDGALLASDDFFDVGRSGFRSVQLTAGIDYTLVTSGFAEDDAGAFFNTIVGPGSVSGAGIEPARLVVSGSTVGGPTFNRPESIAPNQPPSGLSGLNIAYSEFAFTVDATGAYTILNNGVDPLDWDNHLVLYADSFDPSDPLANAIAANDDLVFQIGVSGFFDLTLEAGRTYYLVASGWSETDQGEFELAFFGPGGVNVGALIPEPSTLAMIAVGSPVILAWLRLRRVRAR